MLTALGLNRTLVLRSKLVDILSQPDFNYSNYVETIELRIRTL